MFKLEIEPFGTLVQNTSIFTLENLNNCEQISHDNHKCSNMPTTRRLNTCQTALLLNIADETKCNINTPDSKNSYLTGWNAHLSVIITNDTIALQPFSINDLYPLYTPITIGNLPTIHTIPKAKIIIESTRLSPQQTIGIISIVIITLLLLSLLTILWSKINQLISNYSAAHQSETFHHFPSNINIPSAPAIHNTPPNNSPNLMPNFFYSNPELTFEFPMNTQYDNLPSPRPVSFTEQIYTEMSNIDNYDSLPTPRLVIENIYVEVTEDTMKNVSPNLAHLTEQIYPELQKSQNEEVYIPMHPILPTPSCSHHNLDSK